MSHQAVAPWGDDYAHACTHTLVSSFSSIKSSHVGFNEGSLGHCSALSHRQLPHMHLDGHANAELSEQSHTPSESMLKCTEIGSLPSSISAESVGKDVNTWNRMAVSDMMRFKVSEHRIILGTFRTPPLVLCSASQCFITWNIKIPQYKAQILSANLLKVFGIGQNRRELFSIPLRLLLILLS